MKKKLILVAALTLAAALLLTGCTTLDVVAKDSARAFKDVLTVLPAQDGAASEWFLATPDGGAEFRWSGALVQIKAASQPFIGAGLDVSKLDNADDEWIYYAEDFAMEPQTKANAAAQFEYIVGVGRKNVGYHAEMDHYNILLGDGNLFEWAKDMAANDKDIVFALNPEPLIEAGIDPEKLEGWAYAQVPVMVDGKAEQVWKFLKPVDLK
ncbi:hypothetical protein FACS1894184_17480 [Clostridia bacterium]|nr:hypothetical protein FACS1894184_17480 [Clostridia bacterium]